uniref:rRNA N-glycosylase n=1 Tax=Opuntia streptacantha TaxID=393608 RepID=A0A7C9DNE6_OPUST
MRKATLIVRTISIWAMLIFTVEGLTWDLASEDADSYTKMLTGLRDQVKGTTCFKIPMISKTPKTSYVFVDLKASATQIISVALKAADLYVVGYADTYTDPKTGKPQQRAFVLKSEKAGENFKGAFPTAKVEELSYTGSYLDIEKPINAGDRKKLDLTRAGMELLFQTIYGKQFDKSDLKKRQAQFLLAAIQMIAEAARFKYIEKLVEDQYEGYSFVMNDKMYSIVKKWDTISTAIANAKSSGQFIKNENGKEVPLTLVLVGPDGKNYDATNVKDVESDMGILKYVDKKCAVTLSLHPMTIEWPLTLTRVLAHV